MSLTITLRTALSGLSLQQSALQVAAHNISNVNTEGYSRKILQATSVRLGGIGAGVRIADISRHVDEFLLRQVRDSLGVVGNFEIRDQFLSQTQNMFGTPGDHNSISARLTDLATALDSLAHEPEGASTQFAAVNAAILMASQLKEMSRDLQKLRAETDQAITNSANFINTQLGIVASLNAQVVRERNLGQPISELEDARDVALNKIATEMDVRYFERTRGDIVIMSPGGRALLLDSTVTTLRHTPASNLDPSVTYIDPSITGFYGTGGIDGLFVGAPEPGGTNDITREITTGKIQGYVELRDKTLTGLQSQLDELAYRLKEVLNAAHNDGAAFPPPIVLTGTKIFAANDALTGSGNLQIAVVNQSTGAIVNVQQIAVTGPTVASMVAAVDTAFGGGGFATLTAGGTLRLNTGVLGANLGIVVAENDSAISIAAESRGFSHFFGLNNLVDDAAAYASYDTVVQGGASTALNVAGNLVFSLPAGGGTTVAIAATDSLAQIAVAINGNATLTAANVTARLVSDGGGYRLNIIDADANNFFLSGTGNVMSILGFAANKVGGAGLTSVRSDISADPRLITRGDVSYDTTLVAGNIRIGTGDGSAAQRLADAFNQNHKFALAGGLPQLTVTVAHYASQLLALNASQAANANTELEFSASLREQLKARVASTSGVNIDEELANLIILENAYAATARVVAVTDNMFEALLGALL